MSVSAHTSSKIKNLRIQKALGTEFLIFTDSPNRKVYLVDINSLNTDPNVPNSVNIEINNKKQEIPIHPTDPIELTETAGNDNLLAIGWTEEKQKGVTYNITLVAVTLQNGILSYTKCQNGSRTINVTNVEELRVFIKNNEAKIVDIHRRGDDNYTLDAFGH